MTIRLTEHKTLHHQRLIALIFIIIAAAIVGYFAIASMYLKEAPVEVVVEPPAKVDDETGNMIYFSAVQKGQANTVTYAYNLSKDQWGPVLDYPGHTSYSPIGLKTGIVTMPNLDIDPADFTLTNDYLPAYYDQSTGQFNYLKTPEGIDESYYRIAPSENATVAYMQRVDEAIDPQSIEAWQIVIHQFDPMMNIVIDSAIYPQWVSDTQLVIMRTDGLYVYDTTTGAEQFIDVFYDQFNLSTEYVLGAATSTGSQSLVLTGIGVDEYGVLDSVENEEFPGTPTFELVVSQQQSNGVIYGLIASPDRNEFAALRRMVDPETQEDSVRIDVMNLSSLDVEVTIPLDLYEPDTIRLLGWK